MVGPPVGHPFRGHDEPGEWWTPGPSTGAPRARWRSLVVFFVVACAGSWTCWIVAGAAASTAPRVAEALDLVGSYGPALAALVVSARATGITRRRSVGRAAVRRGRAGDVDLGALRAVAQRAGSRRARLGCRRSAGGDRPPGRGHLAAGPRDARPRDHVRDDNSGHWRSPSPYGSGSAGSGSGLSCSR